MERRGIHSGYVCEDEDDVERRGDQCDDANAEGGRSRKLRVMVHLQGRGRDVHKHRWASLQVHGSLVSKRSDVGGVDIDTLVSS